DRRMALTSSLVPLGTPAPDFALPDVYGERYSLSLFNTAVLVVVFACNHCPYVRHIEDELCTFVPSADLSVVAICPNDIARYPDDAPAELAAQAKRRDCRSPSLGDAAQRVAQAFGAVCTPEFFVYGHDRKLAYRGAFDASTPGNKEPVTASELRHAINLMIGGHTR